MTRSTSQKMTDPQAVVTGNLDEGDALNGRAGSSEFSIGGPNGRGGFADGANPYDLLSASLAACTAMTIRQYARHRQIALSHVEVSVSFHHQDDGAGRDVFERAITLNGDLNDEQRMQLLQFADMCPVGKVLGSNADIRTYGSTPADAFPASASYADDLSELPIPYIDPD